MRPAGHVTGIGQFALLMRLDGASELDPEQKLRLCKIRGRDESGVPRFRSTKPVIRSSSA